MAKGYWINCFRAIKDPAKVDAYRKLAGPVMEATGAKFLVRGDPAKVYEAGIVGRVVVIGHGVSVTGGYDSDVSVARPWPLLVIVLARPAGASAAEVAAADTAALADLP